MSIYKKEQNNAPRRNQNRTFVFPPGGVIRNRLPLPPHIRRARRRRSQWRTGPPHVLWKWCPPSLWTGGGRRHEQCTTVTSWWKSGGTNLKSQWRDPQKSKFFKRARIIVQTQPDFLCVFWAKSKNLNIPLIREELTFESGAFRKGRYIFIMVTPRGVKELRCICNDLITVVVKLPGPQIVL